MKDNSKGCQPQIIGREGVVKEDKKEEDNLLNIIK